MASFIFMEMTHLKPKEWLEREYLRRKKKNPAYSLRRFSEQLNINSGRLSQYLNGKREITPKAAQRLAEKLKLSPKEEEIFLNSTSLKVAEKELNQTQMSQEEFELISEPLHYSLLSLFETHDFQSDIDWMAGRLRCGAVEIRAALQRLLRLGFVVESAQGFELSLEGGLTTTHDVRHRALQKAHIANLQNMKDRLEEVEVLDRDLSSMTMAIDSTKIPLAKDLIKEFRHKLSQVLESGKAGDVYQLNIQLFPMTEKRSKT